MTSIRVATVLLLGLVGCSAWTVENESGRSCHIRKQMSQNDVHSVCGGPDGAGIRPKAMSGGLLDLTPCVADCERYGRHVVLYDCKHAVAQVVALKDASSCQIFR